MKLKKLLAAFVFAVLGVMLIGSIETQAKSNMITLTPSTKKECHRYCYINISVATSEDNIKKLEYQYGKVKKTANKYWKNTEEPYYYEEDGSVNARIYADINGYYSVRVTLKNGKKYVKSIKIKNMKPCSFNSSIPAKIKSISKADADGNYTMTVDYYAAYNKTYDEVYGTKVGDTLDFMGKEAKIVKMFKLDGDGEPVEIKKFEDGCRLIVCAPKDYHDFYGDEYKEYYEDNPEHTYFGLLSIDGSIYKAYEDYDLYGDNYVTLDFVYASDVKLKINKNTRVSLAYADSEKYGLDCYISGKKYAQIRRNGAKPEDEGLNVFEGTEFHIYEVYDTATGDFTDVVSEMIEIYTP